MKKVCLYGSNAVMITNDADVIRADDNGCRPIKNINGKRKKTSVSKISLGKTIYDICDYVID